MDNIKKFKIINQFEMDQTMLVCAGCNNWLTSPIFIHTDMLNYCQHCSESADQFGIPIHQQMLEMILGQNKFMYPCQNDECDVYTTIHNVHEHAKICAYASINCIFCDEEDEENLNELNITNHLCDNHFDIVQKMAIIDPVATFKFDVSLTNDKKVIILDLKGHTFIVVIKLNNQSLYLSVANEESFYTFPNDDFMVQSLQCQTEKCELASGKISNVKQMFDSDNESRLKICTLPTLLEDKQCMEIELKLYLFRFELMQQNVIDDCPICFKRFTTEIYQCSNGHSVCHQCINNINTCAICRIKMDKRKLNLKHVLSNFQFQCPNSEVGCLNFMKGNELDSHIASSCMYANKVQCIQCRKTHFKCNILKHMQENHIVHGRNLKTFEQTITNGVPSVSNVYIRFKNLLFSFNQLTIMDNNIRYQVKLLYHNLVKEAQKYRYEVHFLKAASDNIAWHKIGNICQVQSDMNISSSIDWNFCNKFIDKDRFIVRYCIFEITD